MLRTLLAAIIALAVSTAGAQIVNRPVAAGAISSPGTTAPTTCAVGNLFFKSNATAGQNLQLCTSANTWTGIADGSGAGSFTTLTTSSTTTLSPANANVVLSPTGTGVVTISPATAGTLNNVVIGGVTPLAGTFTSLTASGALAVSSAGPNAIGGAVADPFGLHIKGTWAPTAQNGAGVEFQQTITAVAGGSNYGIEMTPTINKAGSGTHADFTTLQLNAPTIGAGAATLTNATTLKVVAAPSVGTNLRALWVAAGLTQLDGGLKGTTTNDNATAANVGEYQEVNCGIPAASGASVAFTNASPTVGTWTAHPFQKTGVAFGSYACPFTITATAPTGLSTATNYWATPIDANTFHVSTSAANAAAGTWANTSGSSSTSNLTNSIALTTTAGLSPAVLLLTAGDWDCSGQAIRVLGATTSVTNMQTGINSSSTAVGGLGTYFDFETAANIMTATNNPIHSTPTVRLSLASTTAEYLVALDTFTASTNTVSGFLRCRRMR